MGHTRAVTFDLPDVEAPTEVELDRAAGLTLRWPDGTVSHFGLEELRRNCPCAECRGLREQGRVVGPIRWSDGHGTGIFAWSILRAWQVPE